MLRVPRHRVSMYLHWISLSFLQYASCKHHKMRSQNVWYLSRLQLPHGCYFSMDQTCHTIKPSLWKHCTKGSHMWQNSVRATKIFLYYYLYSDFWWVSFPLQRLCPCWGSWSLRSKLLSSRGGWGSLDVVAFNLSTCELNKESTASLLNPCPLPAI